MNLFSIVEWMNFKFSPYPIIICESEPNKIFHFVSGFRLKHNNDYNDKILIFISIIISKDSRFESHRSQVNFFSNNVDLGPKKSLWIQLKRKWANVRCVEMIIYVLDEQIMNLTTITNKRHCPYIYGFFVVVVAWKPDTTRPIIQMHTIHCERSLSSSI